MSEQTPNKAQWIAILKFVGFQCEQSNSTRVGVMQNLGLCSGPKLASKISFFAGTWRSIQSQKSQEIQWYTPCK
jgi:hypothetical protein